MLEACIYCFSDQPPRVKREHVMPRMLGTFENNWTVDFVCDDCNGFFGEKLELPFGRDSMEALQRLQSGVKKASEHRDLRYKRVEMVVELEGDFKGARARLGRDAAEGVQPVPFPQVGFRPRGTNAKHHWLLEENLSPETIAPYLGPGWDIAVLGDTDEERERVLARVQELGIKFVAPLQYRDSDIANSNNQTPVVVEATLDIPVQRAIAKIALNFAACVMGAECVRRDEFSPVRRFVRFGERPGYQVVQPSNRPILADDMRDIRLTNGHVIVCEWQNRDALVVRFSPFNFITYRVALCERYRGLWHDVACGYVFDHESHQILPLTSTRLVKPPYR